MKVFLLSKDFFGGYHYDEIIKTFSVFNPSHRI